MTEEQKRVITKIDNLTFALWGVNNAIRHIEVCCDACGECTTWKRGCSVGNSYRKLKTTHQLLSEEIKELEKLKKTEDESYWEELSSFLTDEEAEPYR